MTSKLFYNNVYLKEFYSDIIEIQKVEDQYHIVLQQTGFYPEGGGQPSDTGTIGDLNVSYVYEKDQVVYHVTNEKPTILEHIKCLIDWEKRFDHMQQHLGQHILSACFDKLFHAETVGFHLGTDLVTIDVTTEPLSIEQLQRVEYFANQIVFNNLSVNQLYPSPTELTALPLRKPPKVNENIRIIEIDQFDYSPCGGTHPKQTGEVGIIKIRRIEKVRDTTRVEFLCGNRALKDYQWKNNSINKIANLLFIKDTDSTMMVERLHEELSVIKKENRKMKDDLLNYEVASLYDAASKEQDVKIVIQVFHEREFTEVRKLCARIVSNPKVIALFGVMNEKAQLIFSCSNDININMNELFKEVCPMINGKGGGNAKMAQGGGDDKANLHGALLAATNIIKNRYLK